MTATLQPYPVFQALDDSGVALAGALLYTYQPGTTTPKAAYTTAAGTVALANPVVCDSAGRIAGGLWLKGAYKFVLKTAGGSTIWTLDNVSTQPGYVATALVGDDSTDNVAAFTALEAQSAPGLILVTPGTYRIASTLTLAKTYQLMPGAILRPAASTTLTLSQAPQAGRWQIFNADRSATGTVVFGLGATDTVVPEWWGAVRDSQGAAGTNVTALRSAVLSVSGTGFRGVTISLARGIYYVNAPVDLLNTALDSTDLLTLAGQGKRQTILSTTNDTAASVLTYDNGASGTSFGTSYHHLALRDFEIQKTLSTTLGVSWHPGTALHCVGVRYSTFERLQVNGFTLAINNYAGWGNGYHAVTLGRNFQGLLIDDYSHWALLDHVEVIDFGKTSDGTGYGIKATGGSSGGTITSLDLESSRAPGLILEAVHGWSVDGGNIESFTNTWAIQLKGSATENLADVRNWTTGVVLRGLRFYNALGIAIFNGTGWVTIDGNAWRSNYPTSGHLGFNATYGVKDSVVNYDTVRAINYTSTNHWLLGAEPVSHQTLARAYRKDGLAMQAAAPTNGSWDQDEVVWRLAHSTAGWKTQTGGTAGTLNSSATTGDTTNASTAVVLSSLTGIYAGAYVSIAGVSNGPHKVGQVDVDLLTAYVSPAPNATVAGAAVSYSAPVFTVCGQAAGVQSVAYAATIAPNLALGSIVVVGQLTGNMTVNEPTNVVDGDQVVYQFYTDGSIRTITWHANYHSTIGAIAANRRLIVPFVRLGGGVWVQVGTPAEVA